MAESRTRARLQNILDEIGGIRAVNADLTFAEFDRSWAALRATQHALLIVSEAVKNLPPDLKAQRPEIAWKRIRALGNSCATNTPPSTTRASGASSQSTWTRWRRPFARCSKRRSDSPLPPSILGSPRSERLEGAGVSLPPARPAGRVAKPSPGSRLCRSLPSPTRGRGWSCKSGPPDLRRARASDFQRAPAELDATDDWSSEIGRSIANKFRRKTQVPD